MAEVVAEHALSDDVIIRLIQGDLTEEHVDAIVNAANAQLQHGGGVAGAIARKGGPEIQAESNAWVAEHGPVTHDRPAVTGAGNLPCRYVIHAVGPIWGSGDEDAKLERAVLGALQTADELGLQSVALPAISTGIYGFPKERAAGIILGAIEEHFAASPQSSLREVRLTIIDRPTIQVFAREFEQRWPGSAPRT